MRTVMFIFSNDRKTTPLDFETNSIIVQIILPTFIWTPRAREKLVLTKQSKHRNDRMDLSGTYSPAPEDHTAHRRSRHCHAWWYHTVLQSHSCYIQPCRDTECNLSARTKQHRSMSCSSRKHMICTATWLKWSPCGRQPRYSEFWWGSEDTKPERLRNKT